MPRKAISQSPQTPVSRRLIRELSESDLFRSLDEKQLRQILPLCEIRYCETGETLFGEGQAATHLFLVSEGRVAIQIEFTGNQKVTIFTARPGHSISWSALIPPNILTASAEAVEPSLVIAIDGAGLRKLCERNARMGYEVMQAVARIERDRLCDTRLQMLDLIYWIREGIDF